jgi:predicted DNA-binding transcriptional regulator AlpA
MPKGQLLTLHELIRRYDHFPSDRTRRRLIKQGSFPPPIHLGPQRAVWDTAEVDAWYQRAMDERCVGADLASQPERQSNQATVSS